MYLKGGKVITDLCKCDCQNRLFLYKDLLPALCRGGMVLWSAKVPKALRQSSYGPFTLSTTHQKTASLRFVFHLSII